MSAPASSAAIGSASESPAKAPLALTAVLIPVVVSTVLALGVVAGAVCWLLRSGRLNANRASASPSAPAPIVIAPPPSHVLVMEPMVVNLSDPAGRSYLRAGISLLIRDAEKVQQKDEAAKGKKSVDGEADALRDTTLAVLSTESPEALLASDGREMLKAKLHREYKLHNVETRVLEIYFTDFLVQR